MATQTYVPGVCNIGEAEMKRRRQLGVIMTTATVVLGVALLVADAARGWYLALALPATVAASGFIQYRRHFCAGFGMRGVFNLDKAVGHTDTVAQADARAKDRRTAQAIFAQSVVIGLIVGLIALSFAR